MRVAVVPIAHYNEPYMFHVMDVFHKEGHDVYGNVGTKPLKKRIRSQEKYSDFVLVMGTDNEVDTTITVYDNQKLVGTMPIQEAIKMVNSRGIRYTLKEYLNQ